jgi:hypothetical protein
MTTSLHATDTHLLVCKHLVDLPPVVSDWQQSCQQPRCPHYRQGECRNPHRRWAFPACPFDGKELPLEDAAAAAAEDLRPWIVGRVRQGGMGFSARRDTPGTANRNPPLRETTVRPR